MPHVIDLEDNGLTTRQLLESIDSPEGTILRFHGRVIARIEPADDLDLDDAAWAHAPEQIDRGREARARFDQNQSIPHEQVKRDLGLSH